MKFATANLAAHIALETTSMATCWKIKRTDDVIIAATSLDIDVQFDLSDGDGVVNYLAATGFNRSALENSADFNIGNMDIQGLIESTTVTKESIRAELFDFAEVKIFQVNWRALPDGEIRMQRGFLGRITLQDNVYVAEFRDMMDLYSAEIGDIITETCRADLFDTKCGVRESPPDWQPSTAYTVTTTTDAKLGDYVSDGVAALLEFEGSTDNLLLEDGVLPTDRLLLESAGGDRIFRCTTAGTSGATSPTFNLTIGGTTNDGSVVWTTMQANKINAVVNTVTDRSKFTVNTLPATDAPDEHFLEGTVLFTTGPNNALTLRREIKFWNLSTGEITLWRPMPFDITSGEILDMSAGCNKSVSDCAIRFLNIFNYRGEPHVPGNNSITLAPVN